MREASSRNFPPGIEGITDVVARHLCSGCGACAAAQPAVVRMAATTSGERRPVVTPGADTRVALSVCPGVGLEHGREAFAHQVPGASHIWGPVLEVWEGFATDPEIRWAGSSGGVVTALALDQLEAQAGLAVVHTIADGSDPLRSTSAISRDKSGLLAGAGSRYAPASPAEALARIGELPGQCVVIGKPCDIAGTRMLSEHNPALAQKVRLTIGIFCAGTPRLTATEEAVRALGFDPATVASVRYRGHGWPGRFEVQDTAGRVASLTYQESWGGILQRQRQWRCMICADHTSEFADIAVGDPWYREIAPGEPGRSLVLARTERGRRAVAEAMRRDAVKLSQVDPGLIERSQPSLMRTRGAVWGRVATMRVIGMPAPRYRRIPMLSVWLRRLTLRQKVTSTFGTVRRIRKRRLRRPAPPVWES